MIESKSLYRLNWERIFGKQKSKGCFYPIPSEAATTIVQFEPDFKISCLFRPKTRSIDIEYRMDVGSKYPGTFHKRDIQTPTLLMCHLLRRTDEYEYDLPYFLGDPSPQTPEGKTRLAAINHHPACFCKYCALPRFRNHRIKNQFYLAAVDDTKENSIWAQPYRLNNIYEDGRCCFKKTYSSIPMPVNMRQAHNSFWMDRFDNDFNVGPIPHKCLSRIHRYRNCLNKRWRHQCNQDGHHEHPCDDGLEDDESCYCCEEECSCERDCDCCNGRCSCGADHAKLACDCSCCLNICGCRCACDLGEDFANKLAAYKPKEKDSNWTKFICGKKFISIPKRCSGVFFSSDPDLLNDIPKKYHKTNSRLEGKFIIGFAQKCYKGINIDLRTEFSFTLSPNQYTIVQ